MLLLLYDRNRFPFTRNPSWWCNFLVICHGGAFQLVQHHFDSWDSDDLKCGIHGIDENCRSPQWASLSSLYPLLLEIPINLATVLPSNPFQDILGTVRPPLKSFSDIFGNLSSVPKISSRIFLDNFLENNFSFSLQHESLIKLCQNNLHLPECFRGHKSGFTSFI